MLASLVMILRSSKVLATEFFLLTSFTFAQGEPRLIIDFSQVQRFARPGSLAVNPMGWILA